MTDIARQTTSQLFRDLARARAEFMSLCEVQPYRSVDRFDEPDVLAWREARAAALDEIEAIRGEIRRRYPRSAPPEKP